MTAANSIIREAVGVFDSAQSLDSAIAELEGTAFPRHDISVLKQGKEVQDEFGTDVIPPEWAEDTADSPRGISVRPEEKTIGSTALIGCVAYIFGCAAALAAKGASTAGFLFAIAGGSLLGAMIGAFAVMMVGYKMSMRTERQISKGGLLLWVRTPDLKRERLAQDILRRNGGRHIHVHSIV